MDEEYDTQFTDIHSEQTIVEMVDRPDVHIDINAECAVASLMGSPCASSVHDNATVIDQPDITITVDTQPIGDGIHSAAITLSMTILLVVLVLKKFK